VVLVQVVKQSLIYAFAGWVICDCPEIQKKLMDMEKPNKKKPDGHPKP